MEKERKREGRRKGMMELLMPVQVCGSEDKYATTFQELARSYG
jgi:hypothetical protein